MRIIRNWDSTSVEIQPAPRGIFRVGIFTRARCQSWPFLAYGGSKYWKTPRGSWQVRIGRFAIGYVSDTGCLQK